MSTVDNVEYIVVNDPPAGTYRLKVVPSECPASSCHWGMTAMIIRGDPAPAMTASRRRATDDPTVGQHVRRDGERRDASYVAAGVQVELTPLASGIAPAFFRRSVWTA